MSLQEVVAVCELFQEWGGLNYSDITKDGRAFSSCNTWDRLPPPGEIERGEVELFSDRDGSIYIVLGRDGIVTGKRLEPDETFWRYCLRQTRDVFSL
jgi:hypothetical protein